MKYEKPELDILRILMESVITTSDPTINDGIYNENETDVPSLDGSN